MRVSELEECFELNFRVKLKRAGFKFRTQVKIGPARWKYDFALNDFIVIEIDGNGMGHSSVAAKARDAQKANHALLSGCLLFRLTTKHFRRVKGVIVPGEYTHELVETIIKRFGEISSDNGKALE